MNELGWFLIADLLGCLLIALLLTALTSKPRDTPARKTTQLNAYAIRQA
jgi:hypothetical protein